MTANDDKDKSSKALKRADEQDDDILNENDVSDHSEKAVPVIMQEMMMAISSSRASNPFTEHMDSSHITALIENDEKESIRDGEERKEQRRYNLVYTIIGIGLLFGLIFTLGETDPNLFKELLSYVGTFIAGGFGGWGYAKYRKNQE